MRPVVDLHTKLKKHMFRHSPDPHAMTETEYEVAWSLGKEAPICVGASFRSISLLMAPYRQSR